MQKNKPSQNQSDSAHMNRKDLLLFSKPDFLKFFSQKETILDHSPLTLKTINKY
ncbi:hypothetical protein LEP1GSC127_1427 [Leptospira kirschneri str. 200801925]|nr:hypothetical protein [Leptospira kirschneri]EMO76654.1 hypothetical protein LEP1GSC127_1427 [Leptospira kirschneri str. 200801925]